MADHASPNLTGVTSQADVFLRQIWASLGGDAALPSAVGIGGNGDLPSVFAVSDLAAGVVAACGLAITELIAAGGGAVPAIQVDRRLA
ncbi:MAG: hypothetical protein ABSE20_25630, partial [Acetobacteraceae bacterium]